MRNELTVREVVQGYDVHPSIVNRLLLMRKVNARKDSNGRWLIERKSLESWARNRVRRMPKSTMEPMQDSAVAAA